MIQGIYTSGVHGVPYTDHSDMEYAVLFIRNFNKLREQDVEGTIWHPLWKLQLSKLPLVKKIIKIAQLNPSATLYNKYTVRHGGTR